MILDFTVHLCSSYYWDGKRKRQKMRAFSIDLVILCSTTDVIGRNCRSIWKIVWHSIFQCQYLIYDTHWMNLCMGEHALAWCHVKYKRTWIVSMSTFKFHFQFRKMSLSILFKGISNFKDLSFMLLGLKLLIFYLRDLFEQRHRKRPSSSSSSDPV